MITDIEPQLFLYIDRQDSQIPLGDHMTSHKSNKYIDIIDAEVVPGDSYIHTKSTRKTPPYMSQYELSALILARMLQLTSSAGSPLIPMSEIDIPDPIKIATKEVYARLPNLVIRRTLSDGTTEDWLLTDKVNVLEFPRL